MPPDLLNLINSEQTALRALESNDPGIRYHAAWWLGKHRVKKSVPALIRCLNDQREQTSTGGFPLRRQAARSLGLIEDTSCIGELIKTLTSNDTQLHEASIRSLINLGSEECIDSLVDYFDSKVNGKPIESLIEAFTFYEVWGIKDKIKPYLHEDSARIRGAAYAYFFACTHDNFYKSQLLNLLNHENQFVRQSAAFDLARVSSLEEGSSIQNANIPNNIKLHVLKEILIKTFSPGVKKKTQDIHPLSQEQIRWMVALDQLAAETIGGNLLNENNSQSTISSNTSHNKLATPELLQNTIPLLKSRSLSDRNLGISILANLSERDPEIILTLHKKETDQDVIMGLIKVMVLTRSLSFLSVLSDAIGLEVANHCQGNIRRVAACGLGHIGSETVDPLIQSQIVNKLSWTIAHPEDWGLRYSAAAALDRIANNDALASLSEAYQIENDLLVKTRIGLALSRTTTAHAIHGLKDCEL